MVEKELYKCKVGLFYHGERGPFQVHPKSQHHLPGCCLAGVPCGRGMEVGAARPRDSPKVENCVNPSRLEPPEVGMGPGPLPYKLLWGVYGSLSNQL